MNNLLKILKRVRTSQPQLAALSLQKRNGILKNLSKLLLKHRKEILKANARDLKNLKRPGIRDRLVLNEKRLNGIAAGLIKVAKLSDPLGKTIENKKLPNGLHLQKISVPLGVVGVIYESRPNVTIDLAGLAIKSGNALALKGGSEAYNSNKVLVELIHKALAQAGILSAVVYLIDPKSNWQNALLNAHGLVDVLIPRGSNHLITWVRENSKLPVIETGEGVCHTFVDSDVDVKKTADIIVNAKVQRPDVCNALDTLVIHKKSMNAVLPLVAKRFLEFNQGSSLRRAGMTLDAQPVEIFADPTSFKVLQGIYPKKLLYRAKPSCYGKEFLSLKMAIRTVDSFEEGLEFVKKKTSGHSEAILTQNNNHIKQFFKEVDAAVVYANASTRFTDGEEFGMGAEVGISTQKLHARGPMGLEALTSYKWEVLGKGQIRE